MPNQEKASRLVNMAKNNVTIEEASINALFTPENYKKRERAIDENILNFLCTVFLFLDTAKYSMHE